MSQKRYDIFISYRREGGADKARILKTELEARGYKVFLDFDELKDGVFDKRIMDAIDSSPIFMFLLTPNSLERCLNEDDWVRKEIEYAVDQRKHFIPINPNNTFESFPEGLSDKVMEGLGQHNFSEIMFTSLFKESINKLVADRVRPVLAKWGRASASSMRCATVRIETDLDCRILRFGKEIGLAMSGEFSEIKLPKGKHKLQFIGIENKADCCDCIIVVEDLEFEDYIEVKLLDKYNARKAKEVAERKVREEAERKKLEAEQRANAEAEAKRIAQEKAEAEYKAKAIATVVNMVAEHKSKAVAEVVGLVAKKAAKEETERKQTSLKKRTQEDVKLKTSLLSLPNEMFERYKQNGKYGCKLTSGKIITSAKYDGIHWTGFSDGLVRVKLNEKYGFIDKTGNEVIPLKYEEADWIIREDMIKVKLNGKWGFVDKTGKEVIPLKYDWVGYFKDGKAAVRIGGFWSGKQYYIDKNGNRVK